MLTENQDIECLKSNKPFCIFTQYIRLHHKTYVYANYATGLALKLVNYLNLTTFLIKFHPNLQIVMTSIAVQEQHTNVVYFPIA